MFCTFVCAFFPLKEIALSIFTVVVKKQNRILQDKENEIIRLLISDSGRPPRTEDLNKHSYQFITCGILQVRTHLVLCGHCGDPKMGVQVIV